MRIYLAGFKTIEKKWDKPTEDIYLLSSFFEHKNERFGNYVYNENHMLDSGAFSFFGGKTVNWNTYVDAYVSFINKTNQKYFFELDIERIIGIESVENIRKYIENKTGKKPIVVWRPTRGHDYWLKMIEKYPYIAISASGAYDSAWTRTNTGKLIIKKLLSEAKLNNVKVHGLGYTVGKNLTELKFYSVDSTTWLVAGRFGEVILFDKNGLPSRGNNPNRVKKNKVNELNIYNFEQWVKFQRYADKNL